MELLRHYLEQFAPLSEADWDIISGACRPLKLRRSEYFLRQGQISRRIGFLYEGVCRYAATDEQGNEATRYFVQEGQLLSAIDSFTAQQPADVSIQAVTGAAGLVLSHEAYHRLLGSLPVWRELAHQATAHALMHKVQQLAPMIHQDARTRYEAFLRAQPGMLQRVPLGYVASYLGMTPQSLSRLRRAWAQHQGT
jgi:CRP-like cAMP-binding protein